MKVTRLEAPVLIEMSASEADLLRCLLGGVAVDSPAGPADTFVGRLYVALQEAGIDSEQSFSDYFEGQVKARGGP